MRNQSLFKDETKLDINYVPERLPHREKETRLLKEFFSFIINSPGRMSQRVIITGKVGTGKTALCQRFCSNLTSEANKRKLKLRCVHINCREFRGKLLFILQHALKSLRPMFPQRGYSTEEILQILLQNLDEEDINMILVLDEFDSLIENEGSNAVYQLTRLQEMRVGKPQRISLIGVLRNLDVAKNIDESARSTLQRNIIHLEKYSRSQLVDILNERVKMAFETNTVPEDVIELAADLAVSETGNARFAIELLWRAGKYADAENMDVLAPECMRKAVSNIIPMLQKEELYGLGLHEKLFLLSIAEVFKINHNAYSTLVDIESTYAVVCEEFGVKPVSHTQLWKYVQFFSVLGIIKTQVSSIGSRGRTTFLSLPGISALELEETLRIFLDKGGGKND